MKNHPTLQILMKATILGAAAVGVLVFPLAAAKGYSDACWYCNLRSLSRAALLPAGGLLLLLAGLSAWLDGRGTGRKVLAGLTWGLAATLALEVFRITGFRLGWMPGDLPRFIGVQMLGTFSQGPSLASDLAGWAYHFWNGASFGVIYSLLAGRSRPWKGALFGLLIGVGFMASPVVAGLGIGLFGVDFGPSFALTVIIAHLAYGLVLSWGLARSERAPSRDAPGLPGRGSAGGRLEHGGGDSEAVRNPILAGRR